MNRLFRIGELNIFIYVVIFSLFPVITHAATQKMPPVLFAAVTTVAAAIFLFLYLLVTRRLKTALNRNAFPLIVGNSVFNIIIPHILLFIGISKTSSVNAAILFQTEIFFTFLICGLFYGEKITRGGVIGAAITLVGATIVLLKGGFHFDLNMGDLLVVLATVFYPIGNICSKKALAFASPSVILFWRSLIGGIVLLFISLFFESPFSAMSGYLSDNLLYILLNGILLFGIAKIFFLEGVKKIDITKAISMLLAEPAITMIYAYSLLREIPTKYQIVGLALVIAGLYILTRRQDKHTVTVSG